MNRHTIWSVAVALVVVATVVAGWRWRRASGSARPIVAHENAPVPPDSTMDASRVREVLFAELKPVGLKNCVVKRFGEAHDGGYLLCANLLERVQSGYSYGISGYDGWGCEIARTLKVQVHEYDCFDLDRPVCKGGNTTFHAECVAGASSTDSLGRLFETPEQQLARNGDAGRHVVMKIDVEGAEWDTFLKTPDSVLERIDQLAVEFHGVDKPRYVDVVRRLKHTFYIANLHFNNYSCRTGISPFPAWAYEVLFVNKQLGIPDPSGTSSFPTVNAPNNPDLADCQGTDGSAGPRQRGASAR